MDRGWRPGLLFPILGAITATASHMNRPIVPPKYNFRSTVPQPCPYLPGRVERRVVTELHGKDADHLHQRLTLAGFRRSHRYAYKPVCKDCAACLAIRIDVREFRAQPSLRRVLNRNADLIVKTGPARATPARYSLFKRYVKARHGDGDMAGMNFDEFRAMVEDTPVSAMTAEFRDPEDHLTAVLLADRLGDGLSAVYSFFEPDQLGRGLGNFMVLWLIEEARRLGGDYVYLGYWIADSPKMAYKARFRPAEILGPDGWRPLDAPLDAP